MGRIVGRTAGKYAARQYASLKARNPNKSESELARCSWALRYARVEQIGNLERVERARLTEYCGGPEGLETLLSIGRTMWMEFKLTGGHLDAFKKHVSPEDDFPRWMAGNALLEDWALVSGLDKIIATYCDFAMGTLDVEQMCDFGNPLYLRDVKLTTRSIVKHLNRGGCPTQETAPSDFILRWNEVTKDRIL